MPMPRDPILRKSRFETDCLAGLGGFELATETFGHPLRDRAPLPKWRVADRMSDRTTNSLRNDAARVPFASFLRTSASNSIPSVAARAIFWRRLYVCSPLASSSQASSPSPRPRGCDARPPLD
jgi:hypothetical protein